MRDWATAHGLQVLPPDLSDAEPIDILGLPTTTPQFTSLDFFAGSGLVRLGLERRVSGNGRCRRCACDPLGYLQLTSTPRRSIQERPWPKRRKR